MARANVKGTLYLLCFPGGLQSREGCFSRHYLGFSENGVDERIEQHLSGRGSPLVKAAVERGLEPELVRTWPECHPQRRAQAEALQESSEALSSLFF